MPEQPPPYPPVDDFGPRPVCVGCNVPMSRDEQVITAGQTVYELWRCRDCVSSIRRGVDPWALAPTAHTDGAS